jgi:2-dehydropantoate 2-reductase
MSNLRWLCFGAGALGTYLGGSLALAGEEIVFLERPAVAKDLAQRGLRLDLSLDRRRQTHDALLLDPGAVVFADSPEHAMRLGPFDVAIFALKSFDTAGAVESLRPFVADLPPVCCFSNGVENEAALAGLVGKERIIPAIVTTAIGRIRPGNIVLERLRGVGLSAQHMLSRRLMRITQSAFLNPRAFSKPTAMKWSKLLSNLIANPTSAILDMTPAEILADPALFDIEVKVLRECLAVMRAQHIPVVDLPGIPARVLARAIRLPSRVSRLLLARAAGGARGGKMPSFHIDLHSGRGKSEVDFLHGAVVRAGRQNGVPTPINEAMTSILGALTNGQLPHDEYARQPKKLVAALKAWPPQG